MALVPTTELQQELTLALAEPSLLEAAWCLSLEGLAVHILVSLLLACVFSWARSPVPPLVPPPVLSAPSAPPPVPPQTMPSILGGDGVSEQGEAMEPEPAAKRRRTEPMPGEQMRTYAAGILSRSGEGQSTDQQILQRLQMTGFKTCLAVFDLKCERDAVEQVVEQKLAGKHVPETVIKNITAGMSKMSESQEKNREFCFPDGGSTCSFAQYAFWMKLDRTSDEVHVCVMVCASSFDMAMHVETYEEQRTPILVDKEYFVDVWRDKIVTETNHGLFSSTSAQRTIRVREPQRCVRKEVADYEVKKIPVFKQKICTREEFDTAQRFLEQQLAKEVVGPQPQLLAREFGSQSHSARNTPGDATLRNRAFCDPLKPCGHVEGPHPPASEECGERQRLMQSKLRSFGFKEIPVKADGNCQFRALADHIYKNQDRHEEVRLNVVRTLESDRFHYECFVEGNFDTYLARLQEPGSWGDHISLHAAADAYGLEIYVFSDNQERPAFVEPRTLRKRKRDSGRVYLSHWADVHYNSLCEDQVVREIRPEDSVSAVICVE